MFVIIVFLISSNLSLYLHDVRENKRKILLLLPAVVFVPFGFFPVMAAFLLPIWPYINKKSRPFFYMLLLLSSLAFLIAPYMLSFLRLSNDAALHYIVKMNEGTYTEEDYRAVNKTHNIEAQFSHAIEKKRKGLYKEAIDEYSSSIGHGYDAKVYNNIANCYALSGAYDTALIYYEKALQSGAIASAYYNMSQIYREILKFDQARQYYQKALEVDNKSVTFYISIKGASAKSFVADETLNKKELWLLTLKQALYNQSNFKRVNSKLSAALILILLFALPVYGKYNRHTAYRCRRCGDIYCSRCEERISSDDVCLSCFRALVQISESTPQERIAKILDVQRYGGRLNRRLKILKLALPGSIHIYNGHYFYGFFMVFAFVLFLSSLLLWLYMPLYKALNGIRLFFIGASIAGAIVIYTLTAISTIRRNQRRWL